MSAARGKAVAPDRAFTLIEMLVVVAIIAILMGILLPATSMVMRSARASKSQSNLRQWGTGMVAYTGMNNERLPWLGLKDASTMETNLAQASYWANAIPPLVGQRPYQDISGNAFAAQTHVPWGPESEQSIFTDPAAQPEGEGAWGWGEPGSDGVRHEFYFNYVPNSQIDNTYYAKAGLPDFSPRNTLPVSVIRRSDATILMLEMRANRSELPSSDPFYGKDLQRHRSDWKRFAARHSKGGHLLFADGHVGWVANDEATTNSQGNRNPAFAGGDWNTNKLVWDPVGPATDQ